MLVCFLSIALASHVQPAGAPPPHAYVEDLSGKWSIVREAAIWREIGVDPDGFTWGQDAEPDAIVVDAMLWYRDVDEDGLPDVFWSIYDGSVAYAFFAHATALEAWERPLALGRGAYTPWSSPDAGSPGPPPMPSSEIVGGRVLLGALSSDTDELDDEAVTIFEFTDGQLVKIVRDVGWVSGYTLTRWNIVQANDDGDLLLYTFKDDCCSVDARLLRAGEQKADRIEAPEEDERIAMHRAKRPQPALPADLPGLHPLRVARELTGFPQEVVKRPIWQRLGVDPSKYDLQQDEEPDADDLADGEYYVWHLNAAVVYEDFDANGLADAFVVLERGFTCFWFVMLQPQPNEWVCAGLTGDIWYEHGFILDYKPPTPRAEFHGGRVFIMALSRSTHDPGPAIREHLFVIENGALAPLWDGFVVGRASQRLELSNSPEGVIITVKSWKTYLRDLEGDAPERIRRWILRPGTTELAPLD